jgi:hypothetical protein
MKAELMDFLGFLLLSSYFSIKKLMVAGHSKVTIDWINFKSNLNLIYLNNRKDNITSLKDGFDSIKFIHIHRQFNKVADNLSKMALKDTLGWLF